MAEAVCGVTGVDSEDRSSQFAGVQGEAGLRRARLSSVEIDRTIEPAITISGE